jgi:hypothetical protein
MKQSQSHDEEVFDLAAAMSGALSEEDQALRNELASKIKSDRDVVEDPGDSSFLPNKRGWDALVSLQVFEQKDTETGSGLFIELEVKQCYDRPGQQEPDPMDPYTKRLECKNYCLCFWDAHKTMKKFMLERLRRQRRMLFACLLGKDPNDPSWTDLDAIATLVKKTRPIKDGGDGKVLNLPIRIHNEFVKKTGNGVIIHEPTFLPASTFKPPTGDAPLLTP